MRLAAFMRANIEPISVELERCAATLVPAAEFSSSALKDRIIELPTEMAAVKDENQTAKEHHQKSAAHPVRSYFTQDPVAQHAQARIHIYHPSVNSLPSSGRSAYGLFDFGGRNALGTTAPYAISSV